MGVPLLMEPNFNDYSCQVYPISSQLDPFQQYIFLKLTHYLSPIQFKFGVIPPLPEDDATLKEPCLDICPNATRRKEIAKNINVEQCPKA